MSAFEEEETASGELRCLPCVHDPIVALGVNNDAAVWCTASRTLCAWSRHADNFQELLRLSFTPTTITLSDGGLLAVAASGALEAYALRAVQGEARLEMHDQFSFRDSARHGGVLSAGATQLAIAQDESVVAVATSSHLTLVRLDGGSDSAGCAVAVSCRPWFGGGGGGCALVCFASPTRLLVCSEEAHLVSVRVDVETMSAARERDGHVLANGRDGVTCLSASFAHDNLLLVGLLSGAVQVLQLDSLQPIQTLQMNQMLRGISSPGAAHRPVYDTDRPWRTTGGSAGPARSDGASAIRSTVLGVSVGAAVLTVLTTEGVLYIHRDSLEICGDTSFLLDEDEKLTADGDLAVTTRNGCWCAWNVESSSLLYFTVSAGWVGTGPSAETRKLLSAATGASDDDVIHAHVALPATWLDPLGALNAAAKSRLSNTRAAVKKSGARAPVDHPVTFGHRVQSSGYSQAVPWSEQQKLKKKAQTRREQQKQAQQFGALTAHGATAPNAQRYRGVEEYDAHPLQSAARTNALIAARGSLHHSSVLAATFAGSGSSLLTCSSDGSAYQLPFPVSKKDVAANGLRGHTGAVLSIDANLSLKGTLAVTGSADGTIRLWKPSNRETALAQLTPGDASGQDKGEVRSVRFFYVDKFVAYTNGRRCLLSRYALESREEKDGLVRVVSPACIEAPLFDHAMSDAQTITAMTCINHFASSLLVLAGSNKNLCVLDVTAQAPLRIVPDAHSRAIHHVAMCTSSRFASGLCGSLAEHTLLTAGLDGVVNMWDLRQSGRAGQFALHKNNALTTVGLALSPTGQLFAVGSEDCQVYVYDTRMAMTALDVLAVRHAPSAVTWHPTDPVLAVGDNAGGLTFFAQK